MPKKKTRPLIAVTMGDPAGIGPEILIKALTGGRLPEDGPLRGYRGPGNYGKSRQAV